MSIFDLFRLKPGARITGGAGESMENAAVVKAATPEAGIPLEYDFIDTWCGRQGRSRKRVSQRLIRGDNGRFYDVLTVSLDDGATRDFYFDVTSFIGS